MLSKYGNCTRLLKIKNKLKIGWFLFSFVVVCICFGFCCCYKSVAFTNTVGKNSPYFVGVFNKTIIPLALVGYETIISQLISNAHAWSNC